MLSGMDRVKEVAMAIQVGRHSARVRQFQHPVAFWLGVLASATGVLLHLPMYFGTRDTHYRMAGMHPDAPMLTGMALILTGLLLALYGLLPANNGEIRRQVSQNPGTRVGRDADPLATRGPAAGVRQAYFQLFRRPFAAPTAAITCLAVSVGLLTFGFQFWVPSSLQHLGLSDVNSAYVLRNSALFGLPLTAVVAVSYGFWSSRRTIVLLALLTGISVMVFGVFGTSAVHNSALLSALLIVPLSGISSVVAVVTAYSSGCTRPGCAPAAPDWWPE